MKCRLQLDNLNKLIFMNKDWLNDFRVGCKSLFNSVLSIEIDVDLEEELEKFEGEFEKDEVVEMPLILNTTYYSQSFHPPINWCEIEAKIFPQHSYHSNEKYHHSTLATSTYVCQTIN
jgi:hypothetical protein